MYCNKNQYCREISAVFTHNAASVVASIPGLRVIPDNTPNMDEYRIVTVINDTDQDIEVKFSNSDGDAGVFVVPKSIRAYTKALKTGRFIGNTIRVRSLVAVATIGKVHFNFAS